MINQAPINDMVLGLAAFLKAQLPSYITAVQTAAGDGKVIPPPAGDPLVGYRDYSNAPAYPFVCVVLASGLVDPQAGGAQWVDATVDIGVALVASEPTLLEKLLLRYLDALINLVGENEGIGGVCDMSQVTGFDCGHGALGEKSAGTVVVTVTMRKEIQT